MTAFFERSGDHFDPLPLARSRWSDQQMHGVAVSGLLACALEDALDAAGRAALVPARMHVDLFRAAAMAPTRTTTRVVRSSPRLMLVDAELVQDEQVMARATGLFLQPSENAPGTLWSAGGEPAAPPPLDVAPESDQPHVPFFASTSPWSDDFTQHQNSGRHATWQTGVPIVSGEAPTTFQAVASIADATNMTVHWGDRGVAYINTDISLVLARRPVGLEIGLRALDHLAHDGVAVGTAEVFDRAGTFGTVSVSALANSRRAIDFAGEGTTDEATRA